MDKQEQISNGKAVRIEALNGKMALHKVGAPSDAYFFSVMMAILACGAALIAFIYFGPKAPDGTFDFMVIKRWEDGHPTRLYLLLLTVASIEMAAYDVFVWKFGALIARLRYRENITERRVASWRLGIQIALAAAVASLIVLFPQKFPHPNGHFPFMLLGFFCVPVALAALHLRRATRKQMH